MRKAYPTPAIQGLTQRIAGSTRYSSTVTVKDHQLELLVESGLQGLELDFPAPLQKSANATLPLKMQLSGLPSIDPLLLNDQIKISLGSTMAAHYLRQKTVEKNARWRVLPGGIGVNVPPPLPDSGLAAHVALQSLNVDEWQRVSSEFTAASAGRDAAPVQLGGAGGAQDIGQYLDPEIVAAQARSLFVMGKKLDNVVVGASHEGTVWQANVRLAQASGHVTWNESARRARPGQGDGAPGLADHTRVGGGRMSDLLGGQERATQIPALDIVAEQFELFNKKLGRLDWLPTMCGAGPARMAHRPAVDRQSRRQR